MILLDLFCGAGGAAMGYHRAGFEVVGVDISPHVDYPFAFIQADALEVSLSGFDVIHASPPCQRYSRQTATLTRFTRHPDLVGPVRDRLIASGIPYVIENVEGAPLVDPVRFCGSSFGLDIRRHRMFESSIPLSAPPCDHRWQTPRFRSLNIAHHRSGRLASVVGVHGHLNYPGELPIRQRAMGIDWMTNADLVEAVPPAYTEHIGRQLLTHLKGT